MSLILSLLLANKENFGISYQILLMLMLHDEPYKFSCWINCMKLSYS